jgi:hypothetical protein
MNSDPHRLPTRGKEQESPPPCGEDLVERVSGNHNHRRTMPRSSTASTPSPGSAPTYMKIYEEFAWCGPASRQAGRLVLCRGRRAQPHHPHLAFDDLADRTKKRAAMQADPAWAVISEHAGRPWSPRRTRSQSPCRGPRST